MIDAAHCTCRCHAEPGTIVHVMPCCSPRPRSSEWTDDEWLKWTAALVLKCPAFNPDEKPNVGDVRRREDGMRVIWMGDRWMDWVKL